MSEPLDDTVLNGLTFHIHRQFKSGQFTPDIFNQFDPEAVSAIKQKLIQFFDLNIDEVNR